MPLRDISSSGLTVSSFRPVTVAANVMSKSQYNTQTSPASGVGAAPLPVGLQNQTDAVIRDNGSRLPSLKDPSGVYSVLMTDSDMALTKRKFVKVSSVGEIELSPDRIEFCVQITSTKPDMTAAKESIRKRDEYIMLALKKLGVPDTGVSTTTMVKRYKLEDEAEDNDDVLEVKILRDAEKQLTTKNKKSKKEKKNVCNNNDEDPLLSSARVKVIKELYVVCGSLNMYMELFSIVNEKLDQQVNVSPPVIRITPENIQQQSQAATKLAMTNAVLKASQLLQSHKNLKATVGKLFYSMEDSLSIVDIAEYQNISDNTTFESLRWKRNNKLVVCKLTSLFEVNSFKSRRAII